MKCLIPIAVYATLLIHLPRPAFAQADEVPALFKSKSAMRVLPAMAGQKLIIEGTRTLLLGEANLPANLLPVNPADMKQEFPIKYEIAYSAELGFVAIQTFLSKTGQMDREKTVVRPQGAVIVAYQYKVINLIANAAAPIQSFLFWWPARQLEILGISPDVIKPGASIDRTPVKQYAVSGEADTKGNVKSVQVVQADKKRLEMRCEFDGSSPIPTHVHVEEYRLGAKLPWETNDVTITRTSLTKEDETMFEIKVDSTFTIFDYRVNSGEPIQYRGSEINKLLKK